jgi:hypothetical protein
MLQQKASDIWNQNGNVSETKENQQNSRTFASSKLNN